MLVKITFEMARDLGLLDNDTIAGKNPYRRVDHDNHTVMIDEKEVKAAIQLKNTKLNISN